MKPVSHLPKATTPSRSPSQPFKRNRNALAHPDAHGRKGSFGTAQLEFERRRAGNTGAGHAERVAKSNGAAVRLTFSGSSAMPSARSVASPWDAKASLSSTTSKSFGVSPSRAQSFCVADGTDAHDAGRYTGGGAPEDARNGCQPMFLRRRLGSDDQCGRAVIDAGGIARGDRATLAKGAGVCELLGRRVRRGCSPRSKTMRRPCAAESHRGNLARKAAVFHCCAGLLLGTHGEGVLILADTL